MNVGLVKSVHRMSKIIVSIEISLPLQIFFICSDHSSQSFFLTQFWSSPPQTYVSSDTGKERCIIIQIFIK